MYIRTNQARITTRKLLTSIKKYCGPSGNKRLCRILINWKSGVTKLRSKNLLVTKLSVNTQQKKNIYISFRFRILTDFILFCFWRNSTTNNWPRWTLRCINEKFVGIRRTTFSNTISLLYVVFEPLKHFFVRPIAGPSEYTCENLPYNLLAQFHVKFTSPTSAITLSANKPAGNSRGSCNLFIIIMTDDRWPPTDSNAYRFTYVCTYFCACLPTHLH